MTENTWVTGVFVIPLQGSGVMGPNLKLVGAHRVRTHLPIDNPST